MTHLDRLEAISVHILREEFPETLPFRLPVQDIYKFTEQGDDRRIVTGTCARCRPTVWYGWKYTEYVLRYSREGAA